MEESEIVVTREAHALLDILALQKRWKGLSKGAIVAQLIREEAWSLRLIEQLQSEDQLMTELPPKARDLPPKAKTIDEMADEDLKKLPPELLAESDEEFIERTARESKRMYDELFGHKKKPEKSPTVPGR